VTGLVSSLWFLNMSLKHVSFTYKCSNTLIHIDASQGFLQCAKHSDKYKMSYLDTILALKRKRDDYNCFRWHVYFRCCIHIDLNLWRL